MAALCRFPILLFLVIKDLAGIANGFQSSLGPCSVRKYRAPHPARHRRSSSLFTLPKLIVFDLDNTLWSPELYQLRKLQRANQTPVAGKDVKLFEGAQAALDAKRKNPDSFKFAIASRTKSVEWAHDLLDQFNIRHLFDHVEIFPGNKRAHFENIHEQSGIHFRDMVFFDDARDGKYGNCEPVSQMGVLSVHCPGGLHSKDIFETGLKRFKQWDKSPNTIVEWNGEMTNYGAAVFSASPSAFITSDGKAQRLEGVVKMVNVEKGYGFIRRGDGHTCDVFFHFSSLPDNANIVEQGDKLSFTVERDAKTGKERAAHVKIESSLSLLSKTKETVKMRVFSMNMPFAALLANGYKTLESRNDSMFLPYPEGTQMLLHVGRRVYPDGNRHVDVMKSGGLTDDEIEQLKSLPSGFGKGMAVAIIELGKTYETTVEERSDPKFQQKVAAFGKDSGRMVTEIKRAEYLKRPVRVSGQGGVFQAEVEVDALPDGWTVTIASPSSRNQAPYVTKTATTKTTLVRGTNDAKPIYTISG